MFTAEEKDRIKNEIEYDILDESELEELAEHIQNMHTEPPNWLSLRSHSREYYKWMYFKNPAGKAWVYRARHNGKLIGAFALAPKRIIINNKIIMGGKPMDMFTNPEYQGLGLMSQLTKRVFEASRRDGVNMWYINPNKNSYPIFRNKWGWIENCELIYLAKILKASPVLSSIIKSHLIGSIAGKIIDYMQSFLNIFSPSISEFEISTINRFDDATDELWQQSHQGSRICLVRDSEYMNWRYVENPDHYAIIKFQRNGKLKGLIILKHTIRRGMKAGEIVDFLYPHGDEQTFNAMLKHSIAKLRQDGCVVAQSWVIEGSKLERTMRRAGLYFKRSRIKFMLSPHAPIEDFYNRDFWLITQGDGNDI